jgi:peptidoglycan/xylan/chitin deacetylase (PgdA/CDA1 family)
VELKVLPKKLIILLLCSAGAHAQSLNILLYHHVAEQTPHSTSTRLIQFQNQLDHFLGQGYDIVDLEKATRQIQQGKALSKKSLALTFDDGFSSVCDLAYPELKKRGLPFTVFVTTDPIDKGYPGYCSWSQLKEMSANGATIANHTTNHAHLVSDALSNGDWFNQVKTNINHAQSTIERQIGTAPMLFAYPYGEYNNPLKEWLDEQGYISFGQQSGSVGTSSDFQALPRFNAAGNYASLTSLRNKITASPLPFDYTTLPDPLTTNNQPSVTVTLQPSNEAYYPHLQCFFNGKPIEVEWLSTTTFSAMPPTPQSNGRHRLNCTAPHRNGSPYYWMSQQWLIVPST